MTADRESEARIAAEESRIREEYARRLRDLDADRYAPWQPSEAFSRESRLRVAASLLRGLKVFPRSGDPCLEVGFGSLGWLGDLINWGVRETDLHGIELVPVRCERGRGSLPAADLRCGSGTELPWSDSSFRLVVLSSVMTSVLDHEVRRQMANEIVRVLSPGGALLWYDFTVNNPANPNVRGVPKRVLQALFPSLAGRFQSVTLALPIARRVVGWSRPLAVLLEAVPFLRSHLVAVLVKH